MNDLHDAHVLDRDEAVGVYPHFFDLECKISAQEAEIAKWEKLPEPLPSEAEKKKEMLSRLRRELDALKKQRNESFPPPVTEITSKSVTPVLPWWQTEYDIFLMATNKGASLKAKNKTPSARAIAKEIEKHINSNERSKGSEKKSPCWDTIRGVLTRWKWKPD